MVVVVQVVVVMIKGWVAVVGGGVVGIRAAVVVVGRAVEILLSPQSVPRAGLACQYRHRIVPVNTNSEGIARGAGGPCGDVRSGQHHESDSIECADTVPIRLIVQVEGRP